MKTLLLSLIVLLSSQSTWGQSSNRSNHTAIDATYEMISIHSKSYYVERVSWCCANKLNLIAVNDSGNVIFKKNIAVYEADYCTRVIKTDEDQIMILGYTRASCDVAGIKDFIAKLDTNGNLLFQTILQNGYVFNTPSGEMLDISQHPDSSFYLVTDTDLLHYTSGGQFISRVTTAFTGINSILALSNGHLLINGMMNAQLKNIEVTTGLTIINQQPAVNPVLKFIQSSSGSLIAKTQQKTIEKYNSALTLVANSTTAINPANYSITDFVLRNDSVFVAGVVSTSFTPFYAFLDANLNLLYQNLSNYKNVRPTGISITNKNKVNVITTGSSNTSTNVTFSGLYQFGRTGNFNSISDIGVLSYVATSTSLQPYYTGPYVSYIPWGSFDVVIRNFGTDTVKQFYLNQFQAGVQCNNLFHKLYQTSIAPGGTVSVQTGTFNTHYSPIILQNQQTYTATVKICFFTTIPNFSNDVNISNDTNCDSVLFIATGLNEVTALAVMVNVFPNPTEHNFSVTCDVPMRAIQIYNAVGILVKEELLNVKESEVKTDHLSAGLYLVKIETEKGFLIKKLIKE